MNKTATGWTVFVGALGVMAALMAPEVSSLPSWSAALAPTFVGKVLAHFGVVAAAFKAGKDMPAGE